MQSDWHVRPFTCCMSCEQSDEKRNDYGYNCSNVRRDVRIWGGRGEYACAFDGSDGAKCRAAERLMCLMLIVVCAL